MIYGLVGYAGAGKSTIIRAATAKKAHQYKILSLSEPIIKMLEALGIPGNILHDKARWNEPLYGMGGKTCRELAQTLGTEWGRRNVTDNLWIDIGIERARKYLTHSPSIKTVIFENIRFPNEAQELLRNGGKLIAIKRPSLHETMQHESEQHIARLYIECKHHIINVDLSLAIAAMRQIIKA